MKATEKIALITGGSSGIGAAIAERLAEAGMHIAITYRENEKGAQCVADRVAGLGRTCLITRADVSEASECNRVVEDTLERYGQVDVLVHNAGGPEPGTILDADIQTPWPRAFAVHVHSALHLVSAAAPHMIKREQGAIVFVSSVAGMRGVTGIVPYSTAKGALLQFARSLASDLAQYGIRVNCVSPGIIRTKFHNGMSDQQQEWNARHRIPIGREGRPEDVADATAFLLLNDYVTGENVTVDGGLTMRIR
jgi:3-oxoacyl-[acyl-carrier protein] reductase